MSAEASSSSIPMEAFKSAAQGISEHSADAMKAVSSALQRLQATDEMTYPSGISLMSAKNDTLLSYLQQLAVLMLARMEGEELPAEAVKGLVRDRVIIEKMRPLESKLRYQVEKLLRKAESAASHSTEDGTQEELDPLSFRPNPEALVSARDGPASGSEDSDEGEDAQADQDGSNKSGVYRPPRVAAMPYDEAAARRSKKTKGSKDSGAAAPPPSGFLTDLARDLTTSANAPYAEGVSGLATAPNNTSKRARKLAEIKDYEEGHMTRLSMSKKEAKQRQRDEEEVALGGGGSLDSRGRGGRGGFGVEVDELLASMDRKPDAGQRRRHRAAPGSEYDELKKYRAERKAVPGDAAEAGGAKRKGGDQGQFDVALQRAAKRSKRSKK